MRFKIQKQLEIVVVSVMVLFALLIFVIQNTIISPKFKSFEYKIAEQKLWHMQSMIENGKLEVTNFIKDWALWDDTYNFMGDRNPEYIKSNLADNTFANNRVNLLIYADLKGHIVWSSFRDYENAAEYEHFMFADHQIPENHPLLKPEGDTPMTGLMQTEYGPMIVSSCSIMKSDETGPCRGRLIMGRLIKSELFNQAAGAIHSCFSLHYIDTIDTHSELYNTVINLIDNPGNTYASFNKHKKCVSYTLMNDIHGRAAYVLELETSQSLLTATNIVFVFLYILTLLCGIIAQFIILYFMKKKMVIPLIHLGEQIRGLDDRDFSRRLDYPKEDEIGCLVGDINKMLGKIEKYENTRQQSEQQLLDAKDRAENTARQLQESLESVNFLYEMAKESDNAKNEFLANMSHEIRTPMNAIIGYSNLLRESNLNEDDQNYVQFILQSGKSLMDIINNLLDLTKLEQRCYKIAFESCNIHEMLNSIEYKWKSLANKKGLDFEIYVAKGVCSIIYTDTERLGQCLDKLISNAIKFTKQGNIRCAIWQEQTDHNRLLHFDIEDTGIGISRDNLSRLFNPFSQLDKGRTKQYAGTGIGLTIVQKIIQMLGGEVTASSEPGKGSTFSIILPMEMKDSQNPNSPVCLTTDF